MSGRSGSRSNPGFGRNMEKRHFCIEIHGHSVDFPPAASCSVSPAENPDMAEVHPRWNLWFGIQAKQVSYVELGCFILYIYIFYHYFTGSFPTVVSFIDLPCDQHQSIPPLVIFIKQLKASACWMAAWSISLSASSSSSKLHFSMDAIASKLTATRESRIENDFPKWLTVVFLSMWPFDPKM